MDASPKWLSGLDEQDMAFIKKFVLSSGSLKEIADIYGVTYPTVRLRLDRLIQKINLSESEKDDKYVTLLKKMALEEKLSMEMAKILITEYRNIKREEN